MLNGKLNETDCFFKNKKKNFCYFNFIIGIKFTHVWFPNGIELNNFSNNF